jgi:hypothetical protein
MRIRVNTPVLDYEGKPVPDGKGSLTYQKVFAVALNTFGEDDKPAPEQMAHIYSLSVKLYDNDEVELTLEDAALIKERVGKTFNPLVYGRSCDLLEGKTTKKK